MYGLLIEGIYEYIVRHYGEEAWQKVREKGGIRHATFTTQKTYSETVIPRLAKAAVDETGIEMDHLMRKLGNHFVSFVGQYGYDMMLKVLGRKMRDFLNGLDNLHEYLRLTYPKLKPPSFHISDETADGLTMHYRTKRKGYLHYVVGQIEQVGKLFFQFDIEIQTLGGEEHGDTGHYVMRLFFDNHHFSRAINSIDTKDSHGFPMSSKFFFEAFPFHIVFDENITIKHIGHSLKSILPGIIGESIDGVFHLVRPNVGFSFENVKSHSNVTFEIITLEEVGRKNLDTMTMDDDEMSTYSTMSSSDGDEVEGDKASRLVLKGQMKYMETWNCFIFLATPVMENLDKMFKLGIYITDLSMHDVSRDLVLVGTQQSQELTQAVTQAQAKSRKLEGVVKQLDDLIRKGDELLSQMLPKAIAAEIRGGKSQSELTSTFEAVTIMFSDIVGFLKLVKELEPKDVMQLLNNVFSKLDATIEKHDAYKVETIADQYMVISGAPEETEYHPVHICELALDFIDVAKSLKDPTTGQPIQLRIGSHTGPAVAGVIGQRCPRYCFFGDTVNTSSRMNSNGEALKIHISSYLVDAIEKYPYATEERGSIEVKGKGEMKTFWLKGRTGPIKGIPKKNKITEAPKAPKEPKRSRANVDTPAARMRTVKEEAPAPKPRPPSPKKEAPKPKPKPPSPKKEPPKPKPPSPKKEPPKPKPPTPKKEPPKPRTPTPKKEPPKPKTPSPRKEPPKEPTKPKPKPPSPKKEASPPKAAPTIRVPEKQAIPTNQVEPITIAVQPAARENKVATTKPSPTKETITGKKVYEDGSNINNVNNVNNAKNGNRNGLPLESPVISEKMNGSKTSLPLMEAAGEIPKGKAQSCTCTIL